MTATETCGICGEEVRWDGRVGQGWVHRDQAARDHKGYLGIPRAVLALPPTPDDVVPGDEQGDDEDERSRERVVTKVTPLGAQMVDLLGHGVTPAGLEMPTSPATIIREAAEVGWVPHVRFLEGQEWPRGGSSTPFRAITIAAHLRSAAHDVLWWAAWQYREALSSPSWGFDTAWLRHPLLMSLNVDTLKAVIREPRAVTPHFVGIYDQPAKQVKPRKPRAKKEKENAG